MFRGSLVRQALLAEEAYNCIARKKKLDSFCIYFFGQMQTSEKKAINDVSKPTSNIKNPEKDFEFIK